MDPELALCRNGHEGMVSGLSPRGGDRRFRRRTSVAHVSRPILFKVAHHEWVGGFAGEWALMYTLLSSARET